MRPTMAAVGVMGVMIAPHPIAEQAGCTPLSSADARFSLRLPDTPQHITEQASDPRLPEPLTSHSFMSIDGRRYFVVSYVDYPQGFKGKVEVALAASREMFLKKINGN